ncbi:MAG: methionyl-tRNA formyltransferase [Armatimonadota bacterium]|nr:methionyl-tRNA formyltransferase [bacterium]MCS7308992.1 methionyl-tRNA formyltransferase [Armatimonadota bacterium]MDW8104918.1 methionyl-tRNA formyltransferase [Armatimonadota bacterium]MDW8290363.1 methionyl-tRNA formyltransferase [Armatimonadota bacterium]
MRRVLFFGSSQFAVPSLLALLEADYELPVVVTQPDRPTGRHLRLQPTPVRRVAEERGLTVWTPEKVRRREFLQQAQEIAPDVVVVAAFGQILPQALLELPSSGWALNVHASLLPKYRGAAPIQYALLNDEQQTGVTIMQMEPTLDTGPILTQRACPILAEDDAGTLESRLAQMGAELLVETLHLLERGEVMPQPQDHARATYAPPITREDSILRWEETARQTWCRVRAMSPKPGAGFFWGERWVKVWKCIPLNESTDLPPGTVLQVERETVQVACGAGTVLQLREVQPESRPRMSAGDWARGARLQSGSRMAGGEPSERK